MDNSHFNTWIADWMTMNPKAEDIFDAKDIVSTTEITHLYFVQTGDASITPNEISSMLTQHEYQFASGGWLVL